jgi:hypothetical protein
LPQMTVPILAPTKNPVYRTGQKYYPKFFIAQKIYRYPIA